jgi:hypothetical protein
LKLLHNTILLTRYRGRMEDGKWMMEQYRHFERSREILIPS